jgi:hypothetical protein
MSSLMAQRVIFSTHSYSGAELIVLSALAWHADDRGVASEISVPALALLSRLSEKQTSRVLKKLTCSGAISAKSGCGRGHHSTYELNLQIFNKSKRSVEYKGGIDAVFRNAALDARIAALDKRLIPDDYGGLFIQNSDGNQANSVLSSSMLGASGRPILKNSLRRRIARAMTAEIKRRAERDADLIQKHLERLPGSWVRASGGISKVVG